jgi:NodT family efflux transporter outer membrane factor (OMF) lipoprotein
MTKFARKFASDKPGLQSGHPQARSNPRFSPRDIASSPTGISFASHGAPARFCRPLLATTLALFATGCMVGPKYKKPVVPAYTAPGVTVDKSDAPYKEAGPPDANWHPATPADGTLRGDWWTIFNNAELDLLEVKAGIQNQTLKSYAARYEQALAQIGINRSQLFPQIGAQPLAQGVRYSAGRPYFSANSANAGDADIQLPLTASWEIDLWGKIRRQVNIAREETQASAADRENAQLSVQAELAFDYFELRADDAQMKLLQDTVKAYQEALRITTNRFQGGISNESDVFQAKTQLQAAVVQLQDIKVQRAQYEHAIAVLIGQPPNSFSLSTQPLEATPPSIPTGLPSQLLERRPDIASAERRAAEGNEQIGIARAAYFPTVGLSAAGGFESGSLANIFDASNLLYAIGPTANYDIFDFGLRKNTSAQARAVFEQNSADYRQTVLTAFQQVEDNLAALRVLATEAAQQHEATVAAQGAQKIFENRYVGGLDNYLQVVTAQQTALLNERNDIDIERRRMDASVLLIKALGGGWSTANLPKY